MWTTKMLRLLIVDDDPGFHALLTRHLSEWDISSVFSLEEAKKSFSINPPDLILLDLNVPPYRGRETWEAALSFSKNTPIILCTGNPELAFELATQASGWFSKDDLEELRIKLIDIAQNHTLFQQKLHDLISKWDGVAVKVSNNV
jgi:CheY-like chemotaxis protein